MSANAAISSPLQDASATRRGALARGAQVFPDGPKTMQDLLNLAGNWSHVVDAGFGPFTLTGEPIELGDLSTGTFADLTDRPGLRRYSVAGGGTEMVLGTLDLGFAIDETNGKLELNGQVSSVSADTLTATSAAFGGLVTVDSSGVTIGVGASLSAPAGTIDDLLVTTLTINGAPYVRRLIDSVDTSTGLALSGGVLSLAAASGSQPGVVTNLAQSWDGAKTFNAALIALEVVNKTNVGLRITSNFNPNAGNASELAQMAVRSSVNPSAFLLPATARLFGVQAYDGTQYLTTLGVKVNSLEFTSWDNAATVGTATPLFRVASGAADFSNVQAFGVYSNRVQLDVAARGTPVALTSSSASIAMNATLANNWTHSTTENTTLANPTNLVAGQHGSIVITQGATPRTMAFGSYWKFAGGSVPSLTATASAVDVLTYYVIDATHIVAALIKDVR